MLDAIFDFFKWLYDFIINSIFEGIIIMLEQIPVPDFISDISTNASAIGGQAAFYMGVFRIDDGVLIVISALSLRFIIKRLPFIG